MSKKRCRVRSAHRYGHQGAQNAPFLLLRFSTACRHSLVANSIKTRIYPASEIAHVICHLMALKGASTWDGVERLHA